MEVEGKREGKERKSERERKATFFNHLTYLIAMNNKCVGLQFGGVGWISSGAAAVCVYVCVLAVICQCRGLGDNHRLELTYLIAPL